MLVESDAWASLGQNYLKPDFAALQRIRSEIVAVQFDQVERVKKKTFVMATVADTIERRDAIVITGNRLAVDDAGARKPAGRRLDDQRKAIGEIIAGAAVEPYVRAALTGNDPKAIVLDLVQPLVS